MLGCFDNMGSCFSTIKVSGSNSNSQSANTAGNNNNHNRKAATNQRPASTHTSVSSKQGGSHYKGKEINKNQPPRNSHLIRKPGSRRQGGAIPCGKRTDFGYEKDFDKRYTIGKLLGHGQFGYTYVATDKSSGDRVAVKRIEKNKVLLPSLSSSLGLVDICWQEIHVVLLFLIFMVHSILLFLVYLWIGIGF